MTKTIFIDTSIFVQENFLEGDRIKTLFDLSEKGHVDIILTEITVGEVKNQFRKRAQAAFDKHNELINDKEDLGIRVLRNNSEGQHIIKKLPAIKKIRCEFNEKFDEALKRARVIISPYATMDIGEVFKKYFNNTPPFGSGKKKEEFPDAFAVAQIEQWAKEKNWIVTVLTNDKDFDKVDGKHISVVKDFDKFLDEQLKQVTEQQRLDKLDELYLLKSTQIDKEIIEWVNDEFDDDSVFDDVANWMEIHDKTINSVKVLSKEYELISTDEDYLTIEINAVVSYKVSLTVDDEESGIWDSEDKVMLFRRETTLELEQNDLAIAMKLRFNIADDEDYDDDFEVLDINDGKAIDIDPDGFSDY